MSFLCIHCGYNFGQGFIVYQWILSRYVISQSRSANFYSTSMLSSILTRYFILFISRNYEAIYYLAKRYSPLVEFSINSSSFYNLCLIINVGKITFEGYIIIWLHG
jgi:hypothetical protein